MQNIISYAITFTVIAALVVSCNENENYNAGQILQNAETIINDNPDSTLFILDSILYPDQLDKKSFNKYNLLLIQAKDKTYRDISRDTIIFKVQKYYIEKNDIHSATLATIYCGRLLQEQKQYEKAVKFYLESQKYADGIDDNNIKGLVESCLGTIYQKQLLRKEANTSFSKAADYYHKASNYKNEISMYINIGNYYNVENQLDSALIYYNIVKNLADKHKFAKEQSSVRQNIGVVYREKKEYDLAKQYMKEGLGCAANNTAKAKIYLSLSKAYNENKQLDSAYYYIQQSLNLQKSDTQNLYLLSITYKMLSSLEEKRNRYKEALEYHKKYSANLKLILKENRNKSVIDAEKKYRLEVAQNENNRIKVKNLETILTLVIIFMLIAIALSIIIVCQIMKLRHDKKKIAESESSIYELQEMARIYDEEKKTLRNIVLHNFDILRKNAALQETLMAKGDKVSPQRISREANNILYGQDTIDWNLLYLSMNERHNRLFDKMKAKYPQLDEDEFRICCLTYAKFNSRQIAIIMQLSINTIHNKNTLIRQKLGIPKFGNITSFLENMAHS